MIISIDSQMNIRFAMYSISDEIAYMQSVRKRVHSESQIRSKRTVYFLSNPVSKSDNPYRSYA